MPVAAVPVYLGHNFQSASPGLRFGMYLRLWEPATFKKVPNTVGPLNEATHLNPYDKELMAQLSERQQYAFASVPDGLCLQAEAIAPFTTGLGNEHPLENGFAFLNPYGLPYLPGSGVKGVLRQTALELEKGDWGESHWSQTSIDALFGYEPKPGDKKEHQRGALSFWDVIPQVTGNSLTVDIMTPHQGHYYQQNAAAGSISPHDSGQPIPITFLTVPPKSRFAFRIACDLEYLKRIAPDLAGNDHWKALLITAFEHAFTWLGFGAKTAVGYGAMRRDESAEKLAKDKCDEQKTQQKREQERSTMTDNRRLVDDFEEKCKVRQQELNGGYDKANTGLHQVAQDLSKKAMAEDSGWTPDEKIKLAEAIETWLPQVIRLLDKEKKDAFKKLKLAALKGNT